MLPGAALSTATQTRRNLTRILIAFWHIMGSAAPPALKKYVVMLAQLS